LVTINPSEGINYAKKTVFVEGKISGSKFHTTSLGGRYVVRIGDIDSDTGHFDATLALNENPNLNPPVHALGVTSPNQAILRLFKDEAFEMLFQMGMTFRAEAIVGTYNGIAWFNVSQIILFEPQFMIGTRQVFNEPFCERRLLLRARGVKGNRIYEDTSLGGTFVGNMVHSTFQEIITSSERAHLIEEFKDDPREFLLRSIQLEDILIGAMGQLGESPSIDGKEWNIVKNQIERLIDSQRVQSLLSDETDWFSEVPVSGNSIHGDIDLRSKSKILELKASPHHPVHVKQLCVYLVGEMLEHGFSVKDVREGYLVSSSGKIRDDNLRVKQITGNSKSVLETLNRFLLARHRLLLVNAGKKLPKIIFDTATCVRDNCDYYLHEETTSGCHFYCQTDRNWSCEGCKHASKCIEHNKYHSFKVLDDANRIRNALNQEIDFQRRRAQKTTHWKGQFKIVEIKGNHAILLKPLLGCAFDPPCPGEKIIIKSEHHDFPTNGQMVEINNEDNNWLVISRRSTSWEEGTTVQVTQSRSELNGIYHLQGCLDELQRLGEVSNREGISFAGGSIVAGKPEILDNLQLVISDTSVTDIFCQSFDVSVSRQLLQEVVNTVSGRILIVTDTKTHPIDGSVDLRGTQILEIAFGARSISDALTHVKNELEKQLYWITSPDILLNTDIRCALPCRGDKFFDYIVIYETNSITGLEYFLMRQYSKHMLTIGDANCVGSPIRSQQSKLLGLGDNLMNRVYGHGFPKMEKVLIPKMVCLKNQPVDPRFNQALEACRLISVDSCNSEKTIEFISCETESQVSLDQLVYSREIDIVNAGPPKELRLKMDELIPEYEMENDLRELKPQITTMLVESNTLVPSTSGRRYLVKQAPGNRNDDGKRWSVNFYVSVEQLDTNMAEADKVIEKVKKLMQPGERRVKPKNLAIMSVLHSQLSMIAQQYETELKGIALRTPYGIRGESWGNVIISCAVQSAREIDTREIYTMIRASRTRVFIIGASSVLQNHPLLRNIQN